VRADLDGKKSALHPVDFVILPAGVSVLGRKQTLPSVQADWRAWLPQQKAQIFGAYVQELETVYLMFSVALNEALELRHARLLTKSYRTASMTPALCARLAEYLGALLRGLGEHAKHYGTIPNTASLDPSNFHGTKEQRTARMSDLLSRVLLTQRSQFLHKIGILADMTGDIGKDFQLAVDNLSSGASMDPAIDWQIMDDAHYDINTCLREAIVLLKSFLLVLPEDQLGAFQRTVRSQMRAPDPSICHGEHLIRARRMASVGRE
jgi:hypothetical protein